MIFPWYVLVYNLPRKLNLSTLSILSPFRVGLSVTYVCHIFYYIAPVFYRDLSAQAAMDTRVTRLYHYNDVIMSAMASQITRLTIVSSTVDTDADHRKLQSSVSLAFVTGDRWVPSTKGQQRGICFHFMTSSCKRFDITLKPLRLILNSQSWCHDMHAARVMALTSLSN